MQTHEWPSLPLHLYSDLDPTHAAVAARDPLVAARATLALIESIPPLTSAVARRSAWLAHARALVVELGDDRTDDIENRLLAAIARTALSAHQTSAGMAAADHAIDRAADTGDPLTEVSVRAARLPHLAHKSPVDGAAELRSMEAAWQTVEHLEIDDDARVQWTRAEMLLARVAFHGATGHLDQLRADLAEIGRLPLPRVEALVFLAYASHASLTQLWLRSDQLARAAVCVQDAIAVCEAETAWAEAANLRALQAAIWIHANDFHAAVAAARSAVEAARRSVVDRAEFDPWLGLPFDLSQLKTTGAAVHAMAEAVLAAQDLGDATAFHLATLSMIAFYLADDRALEALDALTEAREVARAIADGAFVPRLQATALALLRHLGIMAR